MKKAFYKEIEQHLNRVRERRRKRGLKNTLFDYRERDKNRYRMSGSNSIIVLVRAGIPYKEACQILGKTYN